jgi:YYY domain-containing protein
LITAVQDSSVVLILRWLGHLWLLGWVVLPLARRIFSNLPDGGLAAGRLLGLAVPALLLFWGASLHVISLALSPIVMIGLPLLGAFLTLRRVESRRDFFSWVKAHRRALIVSDGIFACAFLLFLWVRMHHPEINEFEKPMDSAIIGVLTRTHFLPADNPWLSGVPFTNYYYFGHLMGALLTRLLAVPLPLAYNLIVATVCALFLSPLWSLAASLTGSLRRGVLAVAVVGLLSHFEPLRQILLESPGHRAGALWPLSWWSTSRVIKDTINEYPLFTMALGDLHAHFFALSLTALYFCTCYALFVPNASSTTLTPRFPRLTHRGLVIFLIGILLGIFVLTNTWDAPLYGVLGLCCIVWTGWEDRRQILWALLPLPLAVFVALPYLRLFQAQVKGAHLEVWSPDAASFWLLWGGFLVLWMAALPARFELKSDRIYFVSTAAAALLVALLARPYTSLLSVLAVLGLTIFVFLKRHAMPSREIIAPAPDDIRNSAKTRKSERSKKPRESNSPASPPPDLEGAHRFRMALGICGLLALLAPMLFYIVGFFSGDLRHQDTVFKFGQQAWLLLGTAAVCEALALWSSSVSPSRRAWRWPTTLVLSSFLTMPLLGAACVISSRAAVGIPTDGLSLHGARFLPESDREALRWLSTHALPDSVVVEAVNSQPSGAYNEFGRVAWLTGVPTPLGWPQHVNFWGGQWDEIRARWQMVRDIYAWSDDATALATLQRLKARYVFVGELERRNYDPAAIARLRAALPVVFADGGTFIVEVR